MAMPKRLPKSDKEKDFDKLMRTNRSSVWEDKGSVVDQGFRSLKQSAKQNTDFHRSHGLVYDDELGSQPGGSMDPEELYIPPKRPILPRFDSFMRGKQHQASRKLYGQLPKKDKPAHMRDPTITVITRGMAEAAQPKWQSLSKTDHFFGGDKNHGLGCDLARHEYESRSTLNRYNNMKAVKQLLAAEKLKTDSPPQGNAGLSLPAVKSPGPKAAAKHGPGYLRLDYADEEGFKLFQGLRRPPRERTKVDRRKAEAAARLEKQKEQELQAEFARICARQAAAVTEATGGTRGRNLS